MKKGVYVEGLTEEAVDSPHQAYQVLTRGYRNRHVGETAMNRCVRWGGVDWKGREGWGVLDIHLTTPPHIHYTPTQSTPQRPA